MKSWQVIAKWEGDNIPCNVKEDGEICYWGDGNPDSYTYETEAEARKAAKAFARSAKNSNVRVDLVEEDEYGDVVRQIAVC